MPQMIGTDDRTDTLIGISLTIGKTHPGLDWHKKT